MRIAINGFGRIGRMVFRAAQGRNDVEIVAINDLTSVENLAYLLKYDTVHGVLASSVHADGEYLVVDGKRIRVYAEKDPEQLPWAHERIDVVVESTGRFRTKELAEKHITAGAKKVLVSAPVKGGVKTIVKGVNEHDITTDDVVVSNASCTTNCFAPMVKVLHDNFGVEGGFMVTVHAVTADQRGNDAPHSDMRRGRGAFQNIVPTSSGAASAVCKVIPELNGKLSASALRVPVPDGSFTYFVGRLGKEVTAEEINHLFKNVAHHHLHGVLMYSEDQLVSSDILGNPHSCIFDASLTEVGGGLVKICGWYDNEVGYSHRMIDLLLLMHDK
ncbi:MAG: type I glyceraldehyde-3-phosphate dehydrogenase [Candidatus Woesearchaeota archaeon]|nr:MAG: type I glyceraldehyde-3-phosphate dehydrogenase [Candidatus Woesearchaeota archaeon]